MDTAPKWYMPTAVAALLWNLLGCYAYLADVTLTAEDIAKLSTAQQAMYAARPAWAVAVFAIAVWGGALGSLGLVLRKRWAQPLLIASLVAVILQDVVLFMVARAATQAGPTAFVLQGLVLVIAIVLVLLGRKATARGWIN
jgi:hypothetical protein